MGREADLHAGERELSDSWAQGQRVLGHSGWELDEGSLPGGGDSGSDLERDGMNQGGSGWGSSGGGRTRVSAEGGAASQGTAAHLGTAV